MWCLYTRNMIGKNEMNSTASELRLRNKKKSNYGVKNVRAILLKEVKFWVQQYRRRSGCFGE